MKRGNAGASLRESINRTRKFVYDQRNPVRWDAGEREALIQSFIEQRGVTKVPAGQSAFQTFLPVQFAGIMGPTWKSSDGLQGV